MIDYNKTHTIKELCNTLNFKYNSHNPKRSLKEIKKYYLIESISDRKHKIIRKLNDDEKYTTTEEEIRKIFIDFDKYKDESGVYLIRLNNTVYVGQTNNFCNRLLYHYRNQESKTAAHDIIKQGATFQVLCVEHDRNERFKKESEYAQKYIDSGYEVLGRIENFYNFEMRLPKPKKINIKLKATKERIKSIRINIKNTEIDKLIKLLEENNIQYEIKGR